MRPSQNGPRGSDTEALTTYEQLKHAILNGEFIEDQSLVESVLATKFNVSRTPIREALLRLEQDGLAERRERGLVVRSRSPEEILDIYETRVTLEAKASAVAAERRSDFDLLRLRQLLEAGEALRQSDREALAANNEAFHRTIWRASRNESLIDLLERLRLHLLRYPSTTLGFTGRWTEAIDEHRSLVDAIERRDPTRASEIATNHFNRARDIRVRLWQDQILGGD